MSYFFVDQESAFAPVLPGRGTDVTTMIVSGDEIEELRKAGVPETKTLAGSVFLASDILKQMTKATLDKFRNSQTSMEKVEVVGYGEDSLDQLRSLLSLADREDELIAMEHIPKVPDVDPRTPGEPVEPPSLRQLNDLSKFLKPLTKEYERFRGLYMWEWGWLLWLQEQLDDDVMCVWKDEHANHGIFYEAGTKGGGRRPKLKIEPWFLDALKRCEAEGTRFIVGLISIHTRTRGYHANALIFDMKHNIMTRFEPHGSETNSYDMDHFDRSLERWLKKSFPGWEYHGPPRYCPKQGPQARESVKLVEEALGSTGKRRRGGEAKGFCSAWSLFFIHFRIMNPDAPKSLISEYFDSMSDKDLSYLIRNYAEFIVNVVKPLQEESMHSAGEILESEYHGQNSIAVSLGEVLWMIKSGRTAPLAYKWGLNRTWLPITDYRRKKDAAERFWMHMVANRKFSSKDLPIKSITSIKGLLARRRESVREALLKTLEYVSQDFLERKVFMELWAVPTLLLWFKGAEEELSPLLGKVTAHTAVSILKRIKK